MSTCQLVMEFHFDVMSCSKLGNENSDATYIKCSPWPQIPYPWSVPYMCILTKGSAIYPA